MSRSAIEEFLYHEAELLDDWRLPEWSELFTDDARYDIASLDAEDPIDGRSGDIAVRARRRQAATREPRQAAHEEVGTRGIPALEDPPHHEQRPYRRDERRRASPCGPTSSIYRTKGDRTVQYMGEAHYLLVVTATADHASSASAAISISTRWPTRVGSRSFFDSARPAARPQIRRIRHASQLSLSEARATSH